MAFYGFFKGPENSQLSPQALDQKWHLFLIYEISRSRVINKFPVGAIVQKKAGISLSDFQTRMEKTDQIRTVGFRTEKSLVAPEKAYFQNIHALRSSL